MTASSTGVAGTPGQIADGVNADYVAEVFSDRTVSVRFAAFAPYGGTGGARLDAQGRLVTAEHDVLGAVLRELQIMNHLLAIGMNVQGDLDSLRREPVLFDDRDFPALEN